MLTHALVKVPTKEAATPALPFHAPAAAPVANTVSPAAPKNIAGVQRTLLHPISGKVSPADVSTVANTPAAREAHPVSSFLGRTLPNLSGRTGAGIGAAVGGLLGAAMPGKDDEGDERSAVGGAIRGMAGGALAGGAAGMVGRRALINPMVKNLQAHPDVTKAVAKQRADVASGQVALGQQKVHDNRIAQSYNVHPNNITDTMRAHDAEHQKVLATNPNAVRNLAEVHQGPALRASFEHSMKNLDAPNAHADWLHQNVVSQMAPAAVSAGLSKLHEAAGHQLAAPAVTGAIPKLKNLVSNTPPAPTYALPPDEATQRKHLAAALSVASQHGFHADASQAIGHAVPDHAALAHSTANPAAPAAPVDPAAHLTGLGAGSPIFVDHQAGPGGAITKNAPAKFLGFDSRTKEVIYDMGGIQGRAAPGSVSHAMVPGGSPVAPPQQQPPRLGGLGIHKEIMLTDPTGNPLNGKFRLHNVIQDQATKKNRYFVRDDRGTVQEVDEHQIHPFQGVPRLMGP